MTAHGGTHCLLIEAMGQMLPIQWQLLLITKIIVIVIIIIVVTIH